MTPEDYEAAKALDPRAAATMLAESLMADWTTNQPAGTPRNRPRVLAELEEGE